MKFKQIVPNSINFQFFVLTKKFAIGIPDEAAFWSAVRDGSINSRLNAKAEKMLNKKNENRIEFE